VNLQHGGAADCVVFQLVQRAIGITKREDLHLRPDGNFVGKSEEILPVLTSVISHAAQDPFVVEQAVIERWDGRHVDAGQGHGPAFL